MPTNTFDQLLSKAKRSSIGDYFKDLFKNNRRIESVRGTKNADGALVFNLKMQLLEDDKPVVEFPAVATISQHTPGNNDKIDLKLQLPSKSYNTDKKMVDVDTSAYQNVDNNKRQIEIACWNCFDDMNYDKEEFSKWFKVDEDAFNFDDNSVDNDNSKYIHELSFILVNPENQENEEISFKMAAIPEDATKETVSLSFEYPDPKDIHSPNLLHANNKYRDVKNDKDEILKKCQDFVIVTYKQDYGVDSLYSIPDVLTANVSIASVKGCKQIRLTLEKALADKGYDIRLSKVTASYDPTSVIEDLNSIAKDKEFVDSLEYDQPTMFSVTVNDDDFDIEQMSEYDQDEYFRNCRETSYNAILDAAYQFLLDNQYLSFIAGGSRMDTTQNYAMNYDWRIQEIIDITSKMVVEEGFILEHPVKRIKRINDSFIQQELKSASFNDFRIKILSDAQLLVDTLTLYSCNLSPDKQIQLQGWLRTWNHEIDYVLARTEDLPY